MTVKPICRQDGDAILSHSTAVGTCCNSVKPPETSKRIHKGPKRIFPLDAQVEMAFITETMRTF